MRARVFLHPTAIPHFREIQERTEMTAVPTEDAQALELLPVDRFSADHPDPYDAELMPCFDCGGFTCICEEDQGA